MLGSTVPTPYITISAAGLTSYLASWPPSFHRADDSHPLKLQQLPILSSKTADEVHFWLNGYVNKQNCRIWSEANPQVYVETPLHPEKLTVWWALWAGAVVPTRFRNMSHSSATIDLLKDTFGDHLISRFGPVNWTPRSCDLIPLDYFLWGYVKSLVYADNDHLEDNIRRVIADIRPQMLEKVIENWTSRLDYIRASRGSPMPEIIF
ncbi:putative DD41D transposase [Trichonephila clavipes]|nr:putative DD41D transposase [Trichonephila clavipes]